MRFVAAAAALLLMEVSSAVAQSNNCVPAEGFTLSLGGVCSYAALREAYVAEFVDGEALGADPSCSSTIDEVLATLLGQVDVEAAVRDICLQAVGEKEPLTLDEITGGDSKFVESFYQGGTDWNEEVETNLESADGSATNVLKEDAADVPAYYEIAERRKLVYPSDLANFDLGTCDLNTVMCCWVQDRQANDNNGNCNTPYDDNCIDKDPADNTDLCAVHLERASDITGLNADGITVWEGDDDDGEGDIHCHGFAWSNDEMDVESRYKGNNLFYVSMYDHMYKRGYVRNVPGAPMCGCIEQMPIVTRSDCTQTDVEESFKLTYVPSEGMSVVIDDILIDFNACQGLNNNNNDLEAYVARLETEGKVTLAQKNALEDHLVGRNNCPRAIERNLASKSIVPGLNAAFEYTHDFPETDSDKFVHGFCFSDASIASAYASYYNLEYKAIEDFQDGQQLWGDRDYVAEGVASTPCAGGIYLQPNKHEHISRFTDITIGATPAEGEAYVTMCAIVYEDWRSGQWPQKLPYGPYGAFERYDGLQMLVGGNPHALATFCKVFPDPPTPTPTSAPTQQGDCFDGLCYLVLETGTTCPAGFDPATEDQCLTAVQKSLPDGVDQGRTNLIGGEWGHLPTGCTIYSGDFAAHFNYYPYGRSNDEFAVVCVREDTSPFAPRSQPITGPIVLDAGVKECPDGFSDISEVDCLTAASAILPEGVELGSNSLNSGWWGHVPDGCSVDADYKAYYNGNPIGKNNGNYMQVCMPLPGENSTMAPTASPGTIVSFDLGVKECVDGFEDVDELDCLDAVKDLLPVGSALGDDHLTSGYWGHVPPGCSMTADNRAHFNANTLGSNNGGFRPVCRKAVPGSLAPTVTPGTIELLDAGVHVCGEGFTGISEADCLGVAKSALPEGADEMTRLHSGHWGHMPFGCSIRTAGDNADNAVHWNAYEYGYNNGEWQLVCGKTPLPAGPTLSPGTKKAFDLGVNRCPDDFSEVSKNDCLGAVLDVMPYGAVQDRSYLIEGSWNHLPSGCSFVPGDFSAHWNENVGGTNNGDWSLVCSAK